MAKTLESGHVRTRLMTPDDVKHERQRLLDRAKVSERRLRSRAARGKLTDRERVALGDLDDLKWLMA
jgi:hypothetical protein